MPASHHSGTPALTDLVDPEPFQSLLNRFARRTGVNAVLVDRGGKPLLPPAMAVHLCNNYHLRHQPAFCHRFYAHLTDCAYRSHQVVQEPCPFDLTVALAPVVVHGRVLAHVKWGQVFQQQPDPGRICHLAGLLQVDAGEYSRAVANHPRIDAAEFAEATPLITEVARAIAHIAQQALERNFNTRKNVPPLAITTNQQPPERAASCYASLFNHLPLVAYSLDPDFKTLFISPSCSRVFGYSEEEILCDQQFWRAHLHPEDQHLVLQAQESLLRDRQATTLEYRFVHRDGTIHHLLNHALPLVANGGVYRIDGYILDITARKSQEQQLLLTEKIKLLCEMSLNVAHEIRNPLTSIGGFARLLGRRLSPDDPNLIHVNIILKEVSRLEESLHLVLERCRRLPLELRKCHLDDVVRTAIAAVRAARTDNRYIFELSRAPHPLTVKADRNLLEQALVLVVETMAATLAAGEKLKIGLVESPPNHTVRIAGGGLQLKPGASSQLFFPFYPNQLESDCTGISLAHQIVLQHGGRVEIAVGPEGRATAFVILPAAEEQDSP